VSPHPDDAVLAELAQGALTGQPQDEVEAHVEQCASCRSLVAHLLDALQPDEQAGPRKGLVVGRYVVLEPVGAGALGEVFAAYDTTLERTVALKWLYPSVRSEERTQQRERLLSEARALARVQHPNVVAVHDVEARGAHDVIVMELVRGQSLRTAPRQSWRSTVAAFADAGRGLAAAHAAGVIHRDFKPDNVLVDAAGRVRVADFGLARAGPGVPEAPADGTKSTLSGTPAYLAPERWSGAQADALTDQFSFCASLYECLAGRLPFSGHDVEARLEAMRRGAAPIPGVPDALDAAVRRGLAYDRRARWPTMEALVRALDAATIPGSGRRWIAATAGVALVASLVPLGLWQSKTRCAGAGDAVKRTWNPKRAAAVRQAFARSSQPSAAALADRVVSGLDRVAGELEGLRVTACEATAFGGESDVLLALRNACLSQRAGDLDALAALLETADSKLVERGVLAVESLPAGADCMNPSRSSAEPMPAAEARARVEAIAPKVSQVRALRLAGKPKDSLALADTLLPEVRAAGWRPLVAEVLTESANGLERAGRIDDARVRYVEGFQLALAANDLPQAFAAAVGLAYLEGGNSQRLQAAQTWARVASSLVEPAGLRGTTEMVRVLNVDGIIALRAQSHAAAADLFAQVERELSAMGKLHTVNGARVMQNRGAALREAGRPEEGLEIAQRSLKVMEEVLAEAHPDVAAAYNNIGSALADLKRYDEAERYYRRCVALRVRLYGEDGAPLATPLYNLGELAYRRGDGETALQEYGRSRELLEKGRGQDDDDVWDAKMGEGVSLELLGRHAEALELLEKVVPELERRKLAAWNVAQAKLGLAAALKGLSRDPARVQALAREVAQLQGERHADQRTQAEALLKQ